MSSSNVRRRAARGNAWHEKGSAQWRCHLRDNAIRRRSASYGGQVEEIKRLDALLEYAVEHNDTAEAERLREELKKLTKMICKTAGTCPANPILAVLFSSPIHRRQNLRAPRSVTYCNMCTGACEVFCFTWFVARSSHKVPPSVTYCRGTCKTLGRRGSAGQFCAALGP